MTSHLLCEFLVKHGGPEEAAALRDWLAGKENSDYFKEVSRGFEAMEKRKRSAGGGDGPKAQPHCH